MSSEELRRLRDFHRFTFTSVLRLEKDPMEFCPEESDLGYLLVPLTKGKKLSNLFYVKGGGGVLMMV